MHEVLLPASLDPSQEHIAYEVEGYATPPAEPGWLLVFRRSEAGPEELLDTPCLIETADGRRLFKRLRRGRSPGRYDLEG